MMAPEHGRSEGYLVRYARVHPSHNAPSSVEDSGDRLRSRRTSWPVGGEAGVSLEHHTTSASMPSPSSSSSSSSPRQAQRQRALEWRKETLRRLREHERERKVEEAEEQRRVAEALEERRRDRERHTPRSHVPVRGVPVHWETDAAETVIHRRKDDKAVELLKPLGSLLLRGASDGSLQKATNRYNSEGDQPQRQETVVPDHEKTPPAAVSSVPSSHPPHVDLSHRVEDTTTLRTWPSTQASFLQRPGGPPPLHRVPGPNDVLPHPITSVRRALTDPTPFPSSSSHPNAHKPIIQPPPSLLKSPLVRVVSSSQPAHTTGIRADVGSTGEKAALRVSSPMRKSMEEFLLAEQLTGVRDMLAKEATSQTEAASPPRDQATAARLAFIDTEEQRLRASLHRLDSILLEQRRKYRDTLQLQRPFRRQWSDPLPLDNDNDISHHHQQQQQHLEVPTRAPLSDNRSGGPRIHLPPIRAFEKQKIVCERVVSGEGGVKATQATQAVPHKGQGPLPHQRMTPIVFHKSASAPSSLPPIHAHGVILRTAKADLLFS